MDGGRRRPFTIFSWEDGGEGPLLEESELVPSSLAPIVPILRAVNEIEEENPRVAPRSLQIERRRAVRRADLCRRRRIRGGGERIHRGSGRWPRASARRALPSGSGHGGHDISTLPGMDIFVTMADGYNAGNTKDGEPRATWMADRTQWAGTWVEPAEDHRKGDHAGMVLLTDLRLSKVGLINSTDDLSVPAVSGASFLQN